MNKGELVKAIAADAGLTQKEAGLALDAFISAVAADLKDGNKVTIPGFGTFEVKKRAARTGINPATKEHLALEHLKLRKGQQEQELILQQKNKLKLLHAAFQHSNLEKALKTNFNFGII